MLRLQRRFGHSLCQPFFLHAMDRTPNTCGRALGLTVFLGSLALTRETEVIGLPQQTLACIVVVMAAGTQLSQVMLAGIICWYIAVRQDRGRATCAPCLCPFLSRFLV